MSSVPRGLDRRSFLGVALAALLLPVARLANAAEKPAAKPAEKPDPAPEGSPALPPATLAALEASEFVYVSPLRASGDESTCHGEVWFAWLDGGVVLITAKDGWKARSVAGGRDRARLWAGNHGRWKQVMGRNEAFRQAPRFDAQAKRIEDAAVLDRLIEAYEKKYPKEIGRWRDRFREGFASGERWILRYEPIPG